MIVSESMQESAGWKNNFKLLCENMLDLFDLRDLHIHKNVYYKLWHYSRVYEYPWAIGVAPPAGRVLDLGANEQFSLTLLHSNICKDMVIHHTFADSAHMGIIQSSVGFLPLYRPRERNKDKFTIFFGSPHQFPWDSEFDVIYNISVMEHIEEENVRDWFTYSWRALKPGGRMVFTIDYLPEHPTGFRKEEIGIENHDLGFVLAGDAILEEAVTAELPWHEDFDPERFDPKNALVVDYAHKGSEVEKLAVYGFVLRKPV